MNKKFLNYFNNIFRGDHENYYIWLIIFIAAFFRLYDLGTESFWYDEIYTAYLISQDWHNFIQDILNNGTVTRNAVYYLLIYFWASPVELTEVSIRSFSALAGITSIGLIYLVGKELFNKKIGLISSLLMAIAEFQIQYSQDARAYSLFVMMTLLSMYLYIIASKTNHVWLWALSSAGNLLLFYTHSYAIFIIFAQYTHFFLYLRMHRRAIISWFVAQVPLLIIVIPALLPLLLNKNSASGFEGGLAWITRPSITDLIRTIIAYIVPRKHEHSWDFIWLKTMIAVLFFAVCGIAYGYSKSGKNWLIGAISLNKRITPQSLISNINNDLLIIFIWFIYPIFIPFFFSLVKTPLFVDRYTICAAPAFYIIMALIILEVNKKIPISVTIISLLIIILPGLQDYYTANTNEQWREVAAFVHENSANNDIVLFTPDTDGFQHKSFFWYFPGTLPFCGDNEILEDDQELQKFVNECTEGYDRFWVIIRGTPMAVTRYDTYFSGNIHNQTVMVDERNFVGITVFLFEKRPR